MILIQIITLAEQLGVHRNTIRNWVKTGKIPARPAPGQGTDAGPGRFSALV